ncbi:MAG: LacI family DNA-binding transcriptional regulator [Clostridia bacterium]|nr:LacI family DNA-binding transcriptional regulator [Clostridia bacterium]
MATIDDIIKLSGASRSTVNRFLAGQQVRDDNAKRIKLAMKELGYRPDKLVEKRKCTIVIIGPTDDGKLPEFQGFAEMMIGMIKALEKEGVTIIIQSYTERVVREADGVIMFGLESSKEDEIIENLRQRSIPFVCAYRNIDRSGVSYVTCDNYLAAYEMTEMLIKGGHKRIAVWSGSAVKKNMTQKLQGFKDCMVAYKLQIPSYLIYNSDDIEDGYVWMQRLLDEKIDFTAFFGLTDAIAIRFVDYAQQRGYKIPQDFAVVAMDGTAAAVYSKPKLTSVTIPFSEVGKKAGETILELIDNPDTICIRKYLKYGIVKRESN